MYVGLREMVVRSSLLTGTLSNAHYAKATWLAKQPNENEIPIDTAQYVGTAGNVRKSSVRLSMAGGSR